MNALSAAGVRNGALVSRHDLNTPALVLDLDALERNIWLMQKRRRIFPKAETGREIA